MYLVDEVCKVAACGAHVSGAVLLVRVRQPPHEPGHGHGALALRGAQGDRAYFRFRKDMVQGLFF